jgi:hypothetical protein
MEAIQRSVLTNQSVRDRPKALARGKLINIGYTIKRMHDECQRRLVAVVQG